VVEDVEGAGEAPPRSTARARVIHVGITVASVALLVYFARRVPWDETLRAARYASPWLLLAATVVNFGTVLLKGVRWWVLLRPTMPRLTAALPVRAAVIGSGLNNILVANGGDAARVLLVARATGTSRSTVLATLVVDQLLDIAGYAALLVFSTTLLPFPAALARWRAPLTIALGGVAALLAVLMWRARSSPSFDASGARGDPATRPRGRLFGALARFERALSTVASGRRVAQSLGLTAAAWLVQVITYALAARAVQMPLPLAGSAAAVVAVNLGLVIRATPGNVGIFQFLYVLAVAPFGVGSGRAVAASVLIQAIQIIPVTLVALLLAPHLATRRAPAPAAGSVRNAREP
jgi:uncharacterized protein (TIRG00374 family)